MPRLPLQPHRQHQRRPPRVRNRSSLKRSANPTRVNLKRWHDPNATRGADRLESLRADNWQSSSRPFGWKLRRLSCFFDLAEVAFRPNVHRYLRRRLCPFGGPVGGGVVHGQPFWAGAPSYDRRSASCFGWRLCHRVRHRFEAPQYAVVARRSVSCRIMPAMPLRPHGQYQQSVPRMRITTRTCFPAV